MGFRDPSPLATGEWDRGAEPSGVDDEVSSPIPGGDVELIQRGRHDR